MVRTTFSACAAKKVEGSDKVRSSASLEAVGSSEGRGRPARVRGRKNMNLQQRMALFESDKWASNATKNAVDCVGCGKKIKLDKRTPFNYEPFGKHKHRCQHINLEGKNHRGEVVCDGKNVASNDLNSPSKPTLGTRNINLDEDGVKLGGYDSLTYMPYDVQECTRTWSPEVLEAAKTLLLLAQAD